MAKYFDTAFNGLCILFAIVIFIIMFPILLPFWIIGYIGNRCGLKFESSDWPL